jgi:hypothetical protein
MLEDVKSLFSKLSDEDKIECIRYIINNIPKGMKLRTIMETGNSKPQPAFDLDLIAGQMGEYAFLNIATSGKHEVKRDFKASETGRIAIEVQCRNKPSGLATTKSPFWVYWLSGSEYVDEVAIIMTTNRLMKILKAFGYATYGGDDNASLLYLVDVKHVLATNSQIEAKKSNSVQVSMF